MREPHGLQSTCYTTLIRIWKLSCNEADSSIIWVLGRLCSLKIAGTHFTCYMQEATVTLRNNPRVLVMLSSQELPPYKWHHIKRIKFSSMQHYIIESWIILLNYIIADLIKRLACRFLYYILFLKNNSHVFSSLRQGNTCRLFYGIHNEVLFCWLWLQFRINKYKLHGDSSFLPRNMNEIYCRTMSDQIILSGVSHT